MQDNDSLARVVERKVRVYDRRSESQLGWQSEYRSFPQLVLELGPCNDTKKPTSTPHPKT